MGASEASTASTAEASDASDANDASEPSLGDGDARSDGVVGIGEGHGAGGEEGAELERDTTRSASGTPAVVGGRRGASGDAWRELSGCTTTRTRAGWAEDWLKITLLKTTFTRRGWRRASSDA